MEISSATPTLLVFTLGPNCERSRRRLLPAPLRQAEALLRQQGLEGALEAGRQAGYRIVVSSPEPLELPPDVEQLRQRGCTFAERLRGAIGALDAELDGSPLLVVGTDAPDLGVHHLQAAVSLLEASPTDVVVGPSLDGGFYLLAACTNLDRELAAVRWCRRDTRCSLEASVRGSGRVIRHLQPLQDLDRYTDLEVWLSTGFPVADLSWLRRWLYTLLAAWRRPVVPQTLRRPSLAWATTLSGRGPPS